MKKPNLTEVEPRTARCFVTTRSDWDDSHLTLQHPRVLSTESSLTKRRATLGRSPLIWLWRAAGPTAHCRMCSDTSPSLHWWHYPRLYEMVHRLAGVDASSSRMQTFGSALRAHARHVRDLSERGGSTSTANIRDD